MAEKRIASEAGMFFGVTKDEPAATIPVQEALL